jgi:hypothetical protein
VPLASCGCGGDPDLYAVAIDMCHLLRRQLGLPDLLTGFQLFAGLQKVASPLGCPQGLA